MKTGARIRPDHARGGAGGTTWTLYIDGGARGNPGPAGAGAVLYRPDGRRAAAESFPLGALTNNMAEYEGLIRGLGLAAAAGARKLEVRSDSELLVRQMQGAYKIRAPHLREAAARAREAMSAFSEVSLTAIPRARNREADRLANCAMDAVKRKI